MWFGDLFIGRTIGCGCVKVRCGERFAWVGVVYFVLLLAASAVGVALAAAPEVAPYRVWLSFVIALRLVDCVYATYTGVRRYIDPRRREKFLVASLVGRIVSAVVGCILTLVGIVLLAVYGSPATPVVAATFYANFVALALFYALVLTPCGWCLICACCCLAVGPAETHDDAARAQRQWYRQAAPPPSSPSRRRHEGEDARQAGGGQADESSRVTRLLRFGALLGTDDMGECAICLESYTDADELRQLPCGHYFHRTCIDACRTHVCPLCKQPISSETRDLRTAAAPLSVVDNV